MRNIPVRMILLKTICNLQKTTIIFILRKLLSFCPPENIQHESYYHLKLLGQLEKPLTELKYKSQNSYSCLIETVSI